MATGGHPVPKVMMVPIFWTRMKQYDNLLATLYMVYMVASPADTRSGFMMGDIRKRHPSAFKAKVALEAIAGNKTLAQIASETGVHPSQISEWKKIGLAAITEAFINKKRNGAKPLYSEDDCKLKIGELTLYIDFLKKKLGIL